MAIWPSPELISVFVIIELVTRNPNLGIPALEDRLFANLLIFNYLCYIFLGREKGRENERVGRSRVPTFLEIPAGIDPTLTRI